MRSCDAGLSAEQEEYRKECIPWAYIAFTDNLPTVSLFEASPDGILAILDDQVGWAAVVRCAWFRDCGCMLSGMQACVIVYFAMRRLEFVCWIVCAYTFCKMFRSHDVDGHAV